MNERTAGLVVNILMVGREGCDIFIGRPSKWGNPFKIGRDGDRYEVIRKFAEYFADRADLRSEVGELYGKRLGCYCAPKACHGEVLVNAAQQARKTDGSHTQNREGETQ